MNNTIHQAYQEGNEREVFHPIESEVDYQEFKRLAKKLGMTFSNEDADAKKREGFERKKAIERHYSENLDTRHWSIQLASGHLQIPNVPLEVKGLALALSSLLKPKSKGKISDRGLKGLSLNDIATKLNRQVKTLRPILKRAETYGMVYSEKVGKENNYFIESDYYQCGHSKEAEDFIKVFQAKMLEISQDKKLNFTDLGILSVLLNHMHYESHIICEDPTSPLYSEMKVWRPQNIADKLLVDIQAVRRTLRKFNQQGIAVEMKAYGIKTIILNPEMFSRQKLKIDMDKLKEVANREKGNLTRKNYFK
ncbi:MULTISPECIES: hypothetical protein [Bacillus cereus group]|uniref:hypothetical protein n=1 Tax=Bacillus cereus group TaxID=86661 RepID=UPI001298CCFA|nr:MULTISPECIES: hypothetical protein [Bacillus cereus group]MCR6787887.1 hypothetical protein [Bacillus thuringiensis]MCR6822427.1 hypothetical protein [Bacillus thuringiensis]MCR6829963.1 hypothetical protein [Bacillus thuringiensis]MEB8931067.1 hypothetical protein [Bacillus cereus]MEB9324989.1 hypothetical protein [Bacillus cereus]